MHSDFVPPINYRVNPTSESRRMRRSRAKAVRWICMILILTGAPAGCRNKPIQLEGDEAAVCLCESELQWMSPVTIVPLCVDGVDERILSSFCTELATALLDHRVTDVQIESLCHRPCPADPATVVFPPEPRIKQVAGVVMYVGVPDFRAYRPMRMAVDVRVVQAANGTEVAHMVDVFEGARESPLREFPREFRLFREREREERADKESYTAYFSNSPRQFITACAHRVVDRLRFAGPTFTPMISTEPPFPTVGESAVIIEPPMGPEEGPLLSEP